MSRLVFSITLLLFVSSLSAQRIVYSEPEEDDTRRLNFEVIGKVAGNFLIYKNLRNKNWIAVYDNDMKLINSAEHNYIPDERLINVDFFPYPDHMYMVYQYQRKNVIYCNAVKVDGMGKKLGNEIELDTTHIGFAADNKIYSAISSEDKSKLLLFKINSRNKSRFLFTTILFDENLQLLKRSKFVLPMEERDDYLREFNVDNSGDFVFAKFTRGNNDNIAKADMIVKPAQSDEYSFSTLNLKDIYLDEPHIKVDNGNKRYFLTSFYYKQRRGNIEGFYFYVFDKDSQKPVLENTLALGEDIRMEAKGEANVKMAFNDYFIRNVIVRKDGGFLIGSEAYYTTSRFNNWNRWNYLYPYRSFYDYQMYSPIYNSWYWRTRQGNNNVRHHADNVALLSFDKNGQLEWSNVIHKEQYDDEAGDHISYLLMNTGGQLHFLFNKEEKRARLLTDFSVDANGKLNRNPILKNLDKGYEFLPKFGKQVSARQMIVPCFFRNYICFAKVDYNS